MQAGVCEESGDQDAFQWLSSVLFPSGPSRIQRIIASSIVIIITATCYQLACELWAITEVGHVGSLNLLRL